MKYRINKIDGTKIEQTYNVHRIVARVLSYFQFNDENHIGTKSFNESTYESVPAEKGQWYAIHYKNLSENNIYISAAAKSDGTDYCFNTLEETAKTLTVENGYFSYYSECLKNEIN